MITAKIIVGLIGIGVGLVGTTMGASAATAPVTEEIAIVTVSGSAGIVAE